MLSRLKKNERLFHCDEFYFRRIPISQIPYQDEAKCAQWLHELFQEKVLFKYRLLYFSLEGNAFFYLFRIVYMIILFRMIHSMVLEYQKLL